MSGIQGRCVACPTGSRGIGLEKVRDNFTPTDGGEPSQGEGKAMRGLLVG